MNDNRKNWAEAQIDIIEYRDALVKTNYKFILYIEGALTCVVLLFFISIWLLIGYILDISATPAIIGHLIVATASSMYSASKAYRQKEKNINRNFNRAKAAYTNRD